MLKTNCNGEIWCVTQPDHGAVAGYLAAHWGNSDLLAPGNFAHSPDAERLRAEVVFAIANHDNGWWEWEAAPEFDGIDGLPLDLTDVLGDQQASMDRWRWGVPRFADTHPYASLLMSWHAYWLYAQRADEENDPAFAHPLFSTERAPLDGQALQQAESFLAELRQLQQRLMKPVLDDPATSHWMQPDHLWPHVRLLQVLDSLSLWMCSGLIPGDDGRRGGPGQHAVTFHDVPTSNWHNRVDLSVSPIDAGRASIEPYPFDQDELVVHLPLKRFSRAIEKTANPALHWAAQPTQIVEFTFCRI
tara:strand:+ start:1116595 stop:1117500 length:906 start_codon:yes stop_codon:yes gene_type:complete